MTIPCTTDAVAASEPACAGHIPTPPRPPTLVGSTVHELHALLRYLARKVINR
jgi:hypothetical protein